MLIECVAFMLIENGRVLAEKRRTSKKVDPSRMTIPGGHIENQESPEDALRREMNEELGVTLREVKYVCTLLHRAEEFQRIHFFAVESWDGRLENREAEALFWIPLSEPHRLDDDVDRRAVGEYLRIYCAGLLS